MMLTSMAMTSRSSTPYASSSVSRRARSVSPGRSGCRVSETVPRETLPWLQPRPWRRRRPTRKPEKKDSSCGRRTWSRYSKEREKETLVPPETVSSMGVSGQRSLPAKTRKGRMAWRMRRALAAAESAAMVKRRDSRSDGLRRGRNSRVLEPMARPETSASVTETSQAMEETCWDLRPGAGG